MFSLVEEQKTFDHIALEYNIALVEWDHDIDHAYILFKYKSASLRLLKKEFENIHKKI